MSRSFRLDINGLRAYAVLAVVLYHFGVTSVAGGFIGVDVFFVISGYLMFSIIQQGLLGRRFSYGTFVLARARRIFPALAVLCVVALIAGWFFLMPEEYQQLGRHVRESLLFTSNIRYFNEAGYFDVASQQKWLLHTWSLSVEWQFYLFLPIVMSALWMVRKSQALLGVLLLVGALVSLGYSLWLTPQNPSQAFYLLPTRAWEMLAGALVAHYGKNVALRLWQARSLETLGFVAILGASVGLDHQTLWPGAWVLLPVAGAVLVLLVNRQQSMWTANAPAQWLGTRSYSIYLWHWPVVVALAYVDLLGQGLWTVLGVAFAVGLGALSYRLVEVPSQAWLSRLTVRKAWILLLGALVVIALAAQSVRRTGFAERLPDSVAAIDQARFDSNPRQEECLDAEAKCLFGEGELKLVVVGDSHADAVVNAVAEAVSGSVQLRAESGCPIVFGLKSSKADRDCEELNRALEDEINVLPSNIAMLMVGHTSSYVGYGQLGAEKSQFHFSKPFDQVEQAFLDEFATHYVQTLCRVAQTRELYVLRALPLMPVDVPTYLGRHKLLGLEVTEVRQQLTDYYQRNAFMRRLQDQAALACGVKMLETTAALCNEQDCPAVQGQEILYRDSNHLTETASRRLLPLFRQHFADL